MALGQKFGLDPQMMTDIMVSGSSRCFSADTYHPVPGIKEGVPSTNNYEGGFPCALMKKDLVLAR